MAVRPATDDGFTAFYEAELDGQVRRAFLLLGSNDAANDVVHDAFVAVFRRWDEIAEPGPYLNRVVLNGCRDAQRREARLLRSLVRLAAVDGEPVVDEGLEDVLQRLPFNQRAAVVLRYYGQLTMAEIAESLDCPIGSVGPWISRALEQMRKALS